MHLPRSASDQQQHSLFISAGDPSGDIAGSHLLKSLNDKYGDLRFLGLGGRRMAALGQQQLVSGDQLAVLGFWEVIKRFAFFRNLLHRAAETIANARPDAVVMIDYPGFNLRLAERIKPLGIPIVYFISPQVWAWGKKRINQIRRLVDKMLVILPFEKPLYDKVGVPCEFVGHYLLDDIAPSLIKAPYDPAARLISLLPGSRPQEVERMLPVMLEVASALARKGDWKFAVAAVEGNIDYNRFISQNPLAIEIVRGQTRELIARSRLVITSSGTATLETGIIGRPMVVIYKTSRPTYLIARHLVHIDRIALINIAAGKMIVPELIQGDASMEKIVAVAEALLTNQELSLKMVTSLNAVVKSLGTPGAGQRAAAAVGEYLVC